MAITAILTGVLIISVTFLIRAELRNNKGQSYFLKPLSTLIIIALIIISFFISETAYSYKVAILLGMLFCLGGDVALMFDSAKAFMIGLVLFLLGHVVYTAAISHFNDYTFFQPVPTISVIVISALIFRFLYPGLKELTRPVIAYVIIISLMLNAALMTFRPGFFNETQAWHLAIGAALFYFSDVILAINKFRFPFKLNRIGLAFYFSGQWMIALSTHYTAPIG